MDFCKSLIIQGNLRVMQWQDIDHQVSQGLEVVPFPKGLINLNLNYLALDAQMHFRLY